MRSGALSKRVELWKKTVENNKGERTETWSFNKNLRSFTSRKSGKQVIDSDEIFDLIKIRITVRNQHDIREQDRIKYFGNMYYIDFIQPDVTERFLTITCIRLNE